MSSPSPSSPERRSFFTRFNAGAASLAALAVGSVALAKPKSAARWEPARHDKDDWMESLAAKHRMVIDTTSADGFRNGLLFAGNFMLANHDAYGLQNQDLAIIVVARHLSTGYAFNNAMWAKYGGSLSSEPGSADPQAKAPKANPSAESLVQLSNQGVRFAVCAMATRRIAGMIASAVGGNVDIINSELIANLVTNGRMVPAGIVALNRAQERGYTLASS